jgi:ornithine lipid ester-linked acyl 2-hydroxylase
MNIDTNNLLDNKYYDTLTINKELSLISDNYEEIKNELYKFLENNEWQLWKDIVKKKRNEGWKTIPIYGFNKWTETSKNFPILKNLAEKIESIKLVSYSKLEGGTILDPHKGWGETSNFVIRNHLGIVVPENCGLWVEGEKQFHKEKEWISFDDSKTHLAFNTSDSDRIVLIIDTVRPSFIKIGSAPNCIDKDLNDYITNA